ncbi:hypothetical protein LIER_41742 [Lithospermum erythrorhizon]|uniref:Uncharacterized protein n=1 Tax=Lithospermum erythrorhizon TaxID=34254 RepID=A0AAV3RHB1_LITER
MPKDPKEPQETVTFSFLVSIIEEEVPTKPSRDHVSLQSPKAEFMYDILLQRRRTLEEIIDLGTSMSRPCGTSVAHQRARGPQKWYA